MSYDDTSSKLVAQEAQKTFEAIKQLHKNSKAFTRTQKGELEAKIKEEKEKWWDRVKDLMKRPHIQQYMRGEFNKGG